MTEETAKNPRLVLYERLLLIVIVVAALGSLSLTLWIGGNLSRWALFAILLMLTNNIGRRLLRRGFETHRTRIRFTFEGHLVCLAVLAFFLSAMNTGANPLYLGLGSLLSALLISRLLAEFSLRGLRVRRSAPSRVPCGESADIEVWIRNDRTYFPNFGLVIEEQCDDQLCTLESGLFFPAVATQSTAHGVFQVRFHKRGEVVMEAMHVKTTFPFGLFEKVSTVLFPTSVIVLPKLYPLKFGLRTLLQDSEKAQGSPVIVGLERRDLLRGLREYRPGDHLRTIHWKASARRQKLIVKEFDRPNPRQSLILLWGAKDSSDDQWEAAVSVAASLLRDLRIEEDSVTLLCYSNSVHVRHVDNSESFSDALELLALANRGGAIDDFERMARLHGDGQRPILVSTTQDHSDSRQLVSALGSPAVLSTENGLEQLLSTEVA